MSDKKSSVSRRGFLKIAGLTGAGVQAGALVGAGIAAGKDSEISTGWESFNPGTQFFNRKPFEMPKGARHLCSVQPLPPRSQIRSEWSAR